MNTRIYTIIEITRNIKRSLEENPHLSGVWVKGEISNLTLHSSGHIYFTLKDESAVLSAVFFKYANKNLNFRLREGMSVLAFGSITVFEKRGSYQLNVSMVKPEGVGELQKKIEELKARLMKEGIFDPAHKKPLPFLPARLGIVTSPTGAALRDIIKVALRRYPNIGIVIAPALVQGGDAPESIVRGIRELNRPELGIDVIIAGRGGGSFEDLMPFNDEAVVRAFYHSAVPIISAVGHQIDHPLSDESADTAAPTPSSAAEMAVPVKKELSDEIEYYMIRLNSRLAGILRENTALLNGLTGRRIFTNPMEIVTAREMLLSDMEHRVLSAMKDSINLNRNRFMALPDLTALAGNIFREKVHRFNLGLRSLGQLSPLGVMKRGYAIVLDRNSRVVRSIKDTAPGERIEVSLNDGSLKSTVESIKKGARFGKEKGFEK